MMKPQDYTGRFSPTAIHVFSLASGALALVYEILWMRRFAVLFGGTAPAAAATLSAFFLGLAAGNAAIGKRSERWARPLGAYGILEAGIALGAILVELLLWLYDLRYPSLYSLLSGAPAAFFAVKIVLAIGAIFVPTFLMGGTLPVLVQALTATRGSFGVRAGGLYAMNTLGATLGALMVPFILLPNLGADWSYRAAIIGSLMIGAAAWRLGAGMAGPDPKMPIGSHPAPLDEMKKSGGGPAFAVPAFLSGFLLMALEVLWTRMFALVHENSIYSFAIVVAVFLVGLSGGAALAREYLRRGYPAGAGLAAAWCVSGLLVSVSPRLFFFLSSGMDYVAASSSMAIYGLRILLLAVPILLPATLISGTILPLLMELVGEGRAAGPALGRLLAINTIGSILGPLLAGFVLSARLGLWWSITLAGVAMMIAAELIRHTLSAHPWRMSSRYAVYALLALGIWLMDPGGLPSVHVNGSAGERVVFMEQGSYGTVAVLEDDSHRWMMLNNHYTLGGTSSARDEGMQAHIPLLLHPAPRNVAFLGLGTGITAGTALLHPVESIVALEIVPEVIRAAKSSFADANRHVIENPRVEVRAEDARNFIKGSRRKFDLIIGDLVVPWRPGESALFSQEHFFAAREALLPGGIFCQWLPLFQLSEEGFGIIVTTFLNAFPQSLLWRGDFLADQPAIALIGFRDRTDLNIENIDRRAHDLAAGGAVDNPYLSDPSGLWMFLMGPLDPQNPRYSTAKQNRDGRPWLELLTPVEHRVNAREQEPVPHGRFVAALFEEMRNLSLKGTPLERLDAEHQRWRDAGAELWKASILSAEGKEEESRQKALEVLATMPAFLQRKLEVGPKP